MDSMNNSTGTYRSSKERLMRAIAVNEYVQNLSDLKPSIIPYPQFPPQDTKSPSILVRIFYTSPTHVDTLYARGLHQNNHSKLIHPPFILGTEFVGIIDDIQISDETQAYCKSPSLKRPRSSSTNTEFQIGDRVWGAALGSFAPYIIVSPSAIHHLPEGTSMLTAAGLGASTAPVSYGALVRLAGLAKNETCLVHAAAGGLGVAAVLVAKALGANVIGTVGSEEKKRVVEDLLKDEITGVMPPGNGVITYDQEGWEEKVKALTGRKGGVDVVFDTVGLVEKSIRCCVFGGRIVIVGFVGRGDGKNGVMENLAMNRILLKGIKLLGYRYGETSRRSPEEHVNLWRGFNDLARSGTLQPIVYHHYNGLSSACDALQDLSSRKVYGKIVIEVQPEDREPINTISTKLENAAGQIASKI